MVEDRFKNVLIYDCEAAAEYRSPTQTHKLRLFGCYSFDDDKYYLLYHDKEIRDMINRHHFLVGFNNLGGFHQKTFFEGYDNQLLFYNGFNDVINKDKNGTFRFSKKINIDLMMVIKKRASAMKVKKGMLNDLLLRHSLDFISRTVGVVNDADAKIADFDYNILKKESHLWSVDEKKLIEEYTMRDLEVTKKLYVWLEDYFDSFKEYVLPSDIDSKKYLTCSTAVFTYKSICKSLELKEEYSNVKDKQSYGGGYVSFPAGEHFSGKIYCLDFASLYPSIMHQCNIFSPATEGWTGGGKFTVEGIYNNKVQGKVELLFKKWYEWRLQYKKEKDPREYSLKIQLNAAYGLLGNPSFSHLYNRTSAADVTRLGRQWVKLARKRFADAGYNVIYTDTDSVYLIDIYDDKAKMLELKEGIIKEIKSAVPFPYEKFDMSIDAEISDMWFFKGNVGDKETDSEMDEYDHINKPKKFIKKNYIYRTNEGKIVVKNLGVRKKSLSTLSRKMFWEVLVPKITEERRVKFSEAYLRDTVYDLLKKDLSLAEIRFSVKSADDYKMPSQLQAQISTKYGPGIHFLIPNLRGVGVGKDKKYCTAEEFEKHKMKITDINLENVWAELEYFIKDSQSTLVSFFG